MANSLDSIKAGDGYSDGSDDLWAKDALMDDMATAQRKVGVLPDAAANETMIKSILEGLDKKNDDTSAAGYGPDKDRQQVISDEYGKRSGQDGVEVGRFQPSEIKESPRDMASKMIAARIRLLRGKPEWMGPIKDAYMVPGKAEREAKLWMVLKASIKTFGPIFKEQPKVLYF